jgi:hypothetical protein
VGDKIGHETASNWKKWFYLSDLFSPIVDIVKCDFKVVKDEWADLSAQEKLDIETYICNNFKLVNENLEHVIEDSFSIIINIESEIEKAIEMFKNLKKV